MKAASLFIGLVVLLATGCGVDGAPKYSGEPSGELAEAIERFGSCTLCHQDTALFMIDTGGHKTLDLTCSVCHEDLTPGQAGPGHRGIPDCSDCHGDEQATHQYPTTGSEAACVDCHEPHGSANLSLIGELLVTPEGVQHEVVFTNRDGLADGSEQGKRRETYE